MKEVVWIVNEYNPPIVKRTRQIVLSQHLEESGYEVYIITGSKIHGRNENLLSKDLRLKKVEYDGAHFFVINVKNYSTNYQRVVASLSFQRNIWKLRDKLPKPNVIVSEFAGLFGNTFLKWKHKFGTRVVFDILDLWPEDFVDVGFLKKKSIIMRALYAMEHKSYREADGIIFSFEGGKDYIVEKRWDIEHGGDVDVRKIGYLNNGVDFETVCKQRSNMILNDPELDTDYFKVAYLGSIRRANNLEIIVESARLLQNWGQDKIRMLIYGDGDYRKELEAKAQEYRLENIKFKGYLPVEYAPNMLSRCDICLFNFMNVPILRFGLSPNKLFMYFSSGKPVLSTVKPNFDLVSTRKCGLVVSNTPDSVANGIIEFSKMDKGEYGMYSKNCITVAEEFDYKKLAQVLLNAISGKLN